MIRDVTVTANANNGTRQASTASALRSLVCSSEIAFLMEAHDALSASVAEAAGFRGLWASGLSISSCLGYRDANEASWTEIVDAVHRIVEATQIPVLVDGDSGFGNFNNARLFARKLHQRGAAGVCVEDKSFPKKNSFVADRHPLAEIGEFCGRLQAIRDHVPDPEFVVVARTEALIAGHGQDEALTRAHAYAEAGADAILIHSRKPDPAEILAFSRAWGNRLPVVIVPTKYYRAPVAQYRAAQISTVIWANHNMRAAISAMRQVCDRIIREESTAGIERDVATLEELFDLLKYQELSAAEQKYLPQIASGAP
ncbi:phosphoenolpyruvate mutase [Mesorhizobium sp. ORS 3428]|nr:phosphoenolpyruvate mutase [Mesorhizobium sp. ORS 3428]OHV87551.1 phosphoenolpyruvate mutase [Mesorhizobium sp. ORS 3428]